MTTPFDGEATGLGHLDGRDNEKAAAERDPDRVMVLDAGYVDFVEAWGTGKDGRRRYHVEEGELLAREDDYEVAIVEAARQSTQGSFRGWERDAALLRFLHSHRHMTPFEQAGMTLEVQAPIFVFREWHRHRTQSYNEMSARYTPLPEAHYMPTRTNVVERGVATTNRQAAGETEFRESAVDAWLANVADHYRSAEQLYRSALCSGIPKELARITMPVGHYTRMRASANLRNWLAFLTLRMDPAAQWEIRQYAHAVASHVAAHFPRTWELFSEPLMEDDRIAEDKRIFGNAFWIQDSNGNRQRISPARVKIDLASGNYIIAPEVTP